MGTNDVVQGVTLGIALLGAVLGVMNAWRNWVHDRLRIRVDVARAFTNGGVDALSINIRNLSRFDVTITHIGLHYVGRQRHAQLWQPVFTAGESLPVRLQSRTSCTVIQPLGALPPEGWREVECAYVSTACGNEVIGGGKFFGKHGAALAERSAKARS